MIKRKTTVELEFYLSTLVYLYVCTYIYVHSKIEKKRQSPFDVVWFQTVIRDLRIKHFSFFDVPKMKVLSISEMSFTFNYLHISNIIILLHIIIIFTSTYWTKILHTLKYINCWIRTICELTNIRCSSHITFFKRFQ